MPGEETQPAPHSYSYIDRDAPFFQDTGGTRQLEAFFLATLLHESTHRLLSWWTEGCIDTPSNFVGGSELGDFMDAFADNGCLPGNNLSTIKIFARRT